MKMNNLYSYANGEYVIDPKVSAGDLGFSRGFGVFDFLRTYEGIPFHLQEHLERLRFSAKQIGLSLSKSNEEIERIINRLFSLNKIPEAAIRLIVTGGSSSDSHFSSHKPSFFILFSPPSPLPEKFYEEGVHTITFSLERFLPTCKSLNYLPAIMALQKAKQENAIEALYLDKNSHVLEGTTSNFFFFKKDTLITPKEGILFGITRQVILHLAQGFYSIEERPIHVNELLTASEAFITASNKEVLPISSIDHINIPQGPRTRHIMKLFSTYVKSHPWTTLKLPFSENL